MTIREMEIFVMVYQTHIVTRAAEKLFMAQSAVSRSISEIEKQYGILLFDRLNNRLYPTETAKKLYPLSVKMLELQKETEILLRSDVSETIRIGATTTIGSFFLPKVLKIYEEAKPGVRAQVTIMRGAELIALLEKNDLDFALIESYVEEKDLILEEIFTDKLILVFSPECDLAKKKRISFSDLKEYPLLTRENGSLTRKMMDQFFFNHNFSAEPRMESGSVHSMLEFVRYNLGVAFVPEGIARPYIDEGKICTAEVAGQAVYRKNYLAVHKNKTLLPGAREFLAFFREYTANEEKSH